jgi:hypothetical protein
MSPKDEVDRKALIRHYKETPRPMGVYRIHNTVMDKSLVGSSRNLPAVLNRERFQLDHGSHPNRALQADWNRLGSATFVIEVLDTLSPADRSTTELADDLVVLEQIWLDKLMPYGDRGYNTPPTSGPSPRGGNAPG